METCSRPDCHAGDEALQVAFVQVSIVQQEEADHYGALPQEQFRQAWCHLHAADLCYKESLLRAQSPAIILQC